ncbi:MAG: glycosyltransferase family 39 protein [Acidobacteriota bacterium]|nr:glycosyltransferase family 39 protein [Acidobacteriota bacterium]
MAPPTVMPYLQSAGLKRLSAFLLNYWPILVLISLAALVLLRGLGEGSLSDWDESIYAQVSKEMIQNGDWLTPHWEYKPWFHKPPLMMWLTAIFYRLFKVNEFWSRAASAFSGIGLIVTVYLVGDFLYDIYVGFLAAVILLTSYHFVDYARLGNTDIMLTLFTFVAVYSYLRLKEDSQKWWYVVWAACAFAVMVKGVAGVIASAVIILALLIDRRFVATAQSKHFWQGLLLAVAIVAPWHILMFAKHGRAFLEEYVGYHVIARSTRVIEGHVGGRFYYINELQKFFYPWYYLTPFALAICIKENLKGQSRSRMLLLLMVVVFGIYTAARSKLSWYILPVYPVLSILVASVGTQAFRSYESLAFSALIIGTFVVALIAPLKIVLLFGLVGVFAILFSIAIRRPAYQWAACVMCAFFLAVSLHHLQPVFRTTESSVAKLARIAGSTSPDDREPLIVFSKSTRPSDYSSPAALFYSNRPILLARTLEEVTGFTKAHQVKRIILRKEDIEPLAKDYEVNVLAESEPEVYATIKHRSVQ